MCRLRKKASLFLVICHFSEKPLILAMEKQVVNVRYIDRRLLAQILTYLFGTNYAVEVS